MTTVLADQLPSVIGAIYDAAIDSRLWNAALGNVARFIGGASAALFTEELATKSVDVHCEWSLDPNHRRLCVDHYLKLDSSPGSQCAVVSEQSVTIRDLPVHDEIHATRVVHKCERSQGISELLVAVLDRSTSHAVVLSILRRECNGDDDDEASQRMSLVVPHIRRAVLFSRLIDRKTSAATTFAETLDGLRTGICLVDAGGRVVHANNACRANFGSGDFLSCAGRRITAQDPRTDELLQAFFATMRTGGGPATKGAALPLRAPDGSRYVVQVLPLRSEAQCFASPADAATTALFIRKATIDSPAVPDVIARSYDLTPQELRVLLAIVDVGGVPAVATLLGIAETTVKTHLGRLFAKTGVSRQADLVKIVAGFATPLAD